jgi:hypothetical protein
MSKLREQLTVNGRLREYIEHMLSVIIENNPQLLEIAANGDVPMGSMGMSTNHQRQSLVLSSKDIENKSVSLQPINPTESTKSDLSSTSTTTKRSNDKYCRL